MAALISGCCFANDSLNISIDNHLSKCINIKSTNLQSLNNTPSLNITYTEVKSIAECGCKSALASYTSHAVYDDYDSFLIGGKLSFTGKSETTIPVATAKNLIGNTGLKISFSCAEQD